MSAAELINQIQNLPEQERERIFEFVLHSKKPASATPKPPGYSADKHSRKSRVGWREDFAKVKKEIADENLDDTWLYATNEGDKDWKW